MTPAATATAPAEPKKMSHEHALEKASERTPAVITSPEEFRGALLRWQQQHFNVLTPFANISGLAPSHGLLTTLIQLNTDKAAGEVTDSSSGLPYLKGDDVAPAKNGLRKIAEGLGISTRLEYISVATIPNYWHVKAIASYRGLDGGIVTREASKEWDLRDGSVLAKEFGDRQIAQARKHGLRNCETRAINAAIRECGCGVKQKYSRAELSRPFLAVRVAYQPDMTDPETKRLITERALGGTNAMYPPARELPHTVDVVDDEPETEPRSVGRGSTAQTTAPASTTPAASEPPDPNKPPCADAVKIVKVESVPGVTGNRKWTKYVIVDSTGQEVSTFDKQHVDDAERFKAANEWVEIVTERKGEYVDVIEIVKAGQQPSLLPDTSEL